MDHSMHGGMGGDGTCKLSMLWNWNTIDSCFLSESWHVKSQGSFAASCIGVVLIVVCLEAMRRVGKELDVHLLRQFQRHVAAQAKARRVCCDADGSGGGGGERTMVTFRATFLQQLVRAFLYAVTFGLAYLVMLIAMAFNGWVYLSIVIGAGLGKLLCDWMVVSVPLDVAGGCGGSADASRTAVAVAAASALPQDGTMCCA
ncbi:uncharacterized protein PFL1_05697 [Pseudozyma flocculosa PF-1]|uniref:Copper transport protein n=2 Tax=Pseudozyma flocculosa TaxID=84751 RepID=A0A5C3F9R7_9BASI|nr:uncharacterized protein PFL1_05697 [Pseudozyma flocculosa PF-1]EPQ26718.1 hypothetical protein PFL1_05697 [Pseudozyma flocculosa PF-1]SPO40960.1 related to copper transport protein [Pseudozyma flocculosa]